MSSVSTIRTYLGSRLGCLAFGAGLGTMSLVSAAQSSSWGQALQGIGLVLFGILWFLRPLVINKKLLAGPLSAIFANSESAPASGPPPLRFALLVGAIVCIVVGLAQRFTGGA